MHLRYCPCFRGGIGHAPVGGCRIASACQYADLWALGYLMGAGGLTGRGALMAAGDIIGRGALMGRAVLIGRRALIGRGPLKGARGGTNLGGLKKDTRISVIEALRPWWGRNQN
jgi:hypothetical protein